MKWKKGRQGSNYYVKTLLSSQRFKCDCHILKYPPHSHIPPHTDKVEGLKHHRVNITLKGSGNFSCQTYVKWWRVVYFRPDLYTHSFENGNTTRYVFSFGWCTYVRWAIEIN